MNIWVDEQLSHALAPWLTARFPVDASSVEDLGYAQAADLTIFRAARAAGAVVMTKDSDSAALCTGWERLRKSF